MPSNFADVLRAMSGASVADATGSLILGADGRPVANPFQAAYEQWLVHEVPLGEPNRQRVTIGDASEPRRCRACKRTRTDGATFSKVAHIIPQALGNRELVSNEECDECNEWAGKNLEDDLIKLLSAMRALLPLPTKKGGSAKHKLKSDDGSSYVRSIPAATPPITLRVNLDDDSIITRHDPDRQEVTITARIAPLSMMDVAKALARMAFLALPSDAVEEYDPVRQWYRGEVEYQPIVTEVKIPGTGITRLRLVVYRRREPIVGQAPLIVALGFGLSVYFCYLPGSSCSRVVDTPLPTFGRSPFAPYDPSATKMTILSDSLTSESTHSFTMRYQSRKEIDPAEAESIE